MKHIKSFKLLSPIELLDIKDKVGLNEEDIKAEVARQKQMLKDAHDKLMSLQSKLAQNGQ